MELFKTIKLNQKIQNRRNEINKNSGMTLIEVIIAVAILSLVVIPVVQALTTSMYHNSRARTRQHVTVEAESIMEAFKAYGVTAVKNMFDSATVPGVVATSFIAPSDLDVEPLVFKVDNLKTENGRVYDAEITLNRAVYDEDLLELGNVDPLSDAIFRANKDWDTNARVSAENDFKSTSKQAVREAFLHELMTKDVRGSALTEDDIDYTKIVLKKRRTTYTIKQESGKNKVTAKIVYYYCFEDHPYMIADPNPASSGYVEAPDTIDFYADPSGGLFEVEVTNQTFYDNTVSQPLERVYLCYYPCYTGIVNGIVDEIKINNQAHLSFECYLLKQKTNTISQTSLELQENGYDPRISGTNLDTIDLLHNLNENVATGDEFISLHATISGSFASMTNYAEADDIVRKDKILAYDVNLRVYEEQYFEGGSAQLVTEFKGTATEKNKEY